MLLLLVVFTEAAYAEADPPFKLPPRGELMKIKSAAIVTKRGKILVELFPEDAPWHVANFKYLADKGFYRGTTFHLIYPGYVIQGGGPASNPTGGPGYTLPPEFNSRHHEVGILGMARLPDDMNPGRESNGSQFHIVIGDSPHMNGSYTVFGKVVQGGDVVSAIERGDSIEDVIVYVRDHRR
jgi:cyclophilin family peptidyl-prolyl cis-trans isomerase